MVEIVAHAPGTPVAQETESGVQVLPPEPKRKPGNPFKLGHPKWGGRQKGSPIKRSQEAQAVAEKLGFHVVEFLVRAANEGIMLNPDGTQTKLDTSQRLDAGKAVAPYLTPKLIAQQITGPDGGPVAVVGFDMSKLMSDPAMVEAAQLLALRMSESDGARQIEAAPEPDTE